MGGAPSVILDTPGRLLLGGVDVIADPSFFASNGISAVVSVCRETPKAPDVTVLLTHGILHIDVEDSTDANLSNELAPAVQTIHAHRVAGHGVYVHCHAGISRSTTVVVAYLMAHLGLQLADALAHCHRCRDTVCPNPGFRRQLEEFAAQTATVVAGALRDAHGDALVDSDLLQIAEGMGKARPRMRAQASADWVFRSTYEPVSPNTLLSLAEDEHGAYVQSEGVRRVVVRWQEVHEAYAQSSLEDADGPWSMFDFEGQEARLRLRLQPLVDAGHMEVGGRAGLEWLKAGQRGPATPVKRVTAHSKGRAKASTAHPKRHSVMHHKGPTAPPKGQERFLPTVGSRNSGDTKRRALVPQKKSCAMP